MQVDRVDNPVLELPSGQPAIAVTHFTDHGDKLIVEVVGVYSSRQQVTSPNSTSAVLVHAEFTEFGTDIVTHYTAEYPALFEDQLVSHVLSVLDKISQMSTASEIDDALGKMIHTQF